VLRTRSAQKDLMPVASGDEVLRFAQDDRGRFPQFRQVNPAAA
jgi:hypothetical protein